MCDCILTVSSCTRSQPSGDIAPLRPREWRPGEFVPRVLGIVLSALICLLMTGLSGRAEGSSLDLKRLTALSPYERFEDGRPRVPDELLQQLKTVTVEQAWDVLLQEGYSNQWEGNWQIIHAGVKMVGRALTAQFMPLRPDWNDLIVREGEAKGLARHQHLRMFDRIAEGDVLVVDMFGHTGPGGTILGGNLATALSSRRGAGLVGHGTVRDLEELLQIKDVPIYTRRVHPSASGNVMLTGINVPVRIGRATVLPGDVVLGDGAGVIFIPPHLVQKVLDYAEFEQLKDEFTILKMREGNHRPSDIYPHMSEEVKKEYEEWLKTRKQ